MIKNSISYAQLLETNNLIQASADEKRDGIKRFAEEVIPRVKG